MTRLGDVGGFALDWGGGPPQRFRIRCKCGHDETCEAVEWRSAMHEAFCDDPEITTEELT